jgi:hypothetical protein
MKRCHICGTVNDEALRTCRLCQFQLHDGRAYLARLTPEDVPEAVALRVLTTLNRTDSNGLRRDVPLLEPGVPEQESLVHRILSRRGPAGFSSLVEVAETPGLSSGRFSELIFTLGVERQPYEPAFVRGSNPSEQSVFSASRTELDFTYQLLGSNPGEEYFINPRRCTSCSCSGPSFNEEVRRWEVSLEITRVILDGANEHATVNVTMDLSFNPYDFMQPLDRETSKFQFPALMQLNNNMILYVKLAESGQELTLVSRQMTSQVGTIHHWPPYGMRLHTVGPSDYHVLGDPEAKPLIRVMDGTTFLTGPSNFLNHRADILEHRYTPPESSGQLPSVALRWRPVPAPDEHERQADYYHIYRGTSQARGEVAWTNISGPVHSDRWVDYTVPSEGGSIYYRVVPVWVTSLDKVFEGFPGRPLRVEPAASYFRRSHV